MTRRAIDHVVNNRELYAWLAGTGAFVALDAYAARGRVTFSMCARRVFRTHHPIGRAALAVALAALWVHLRPKERR